MTVANDPMSDQTAEIEVDRDTDDVRGHAHFGISLPDKDLQSQDKLGNFEIQSLTSDYNNASALASSVMKKRDDTANSIIGKI